MKLSEMREVLAARGIQLTKSLGQNFLHDANQLQRIVDAAELSKTDKVLEIGPGLGPLTELLLQNAGEVLAIEKDARLVEILRERFSLEFRLQPVRPPERRDSTTCNCFTPTRWNFSSANPRLERLETRRQPPVFRRLADSGGTGLRPSRTQKDRRDPATRSRTKANGAGR